MPPGLLEFLAEKTSGLHHYLRMNSLSIRISAAVLLAAAAAPLPAETGGRAEYVGGTVAAVRSKTGGAIQTTDDQVFRFRSRRVTLEVPYERINLLEYGQKVDRRYAMAVLVSPLFLLSKSRKHFLTIGYTDDQGRQQAMVFQVGKGDVRSVLVSLEARTGRKVVYQDNESRKAGKG
jgi:hypothetical protein